MRYLEFRPYIQNLNMRPKTPKDLGYYYKIIGSECSLVKNLLEDNGFIENKKSNNNWTLLWSSGPIKPAIYSSLTRYQKVNHFPRSVEITRKDLLYKNISKMQSMFPNLSKNLSFIPQSFLLPNEYKYLEDAMEKDSNFIWIIKPVASSQGRGIYVTNKIQEVIILLNARFQQVLK